MSSISKLGKSPISKEHLSWNSMEDSPLKILKNRDTSSIRIASTTGLVFFALLIVGGSYDLFQKLHTSLGLPIDFKARNIMQIAPKLDERIKIISLDDSTFAYTKKPHLSGNDWANLLKTIGSAQPSAIVTTHMFGTGEFVTNADSLSRTISRLKSQGTQIIAGSFAYPLKISFRQPLPMERPEFQMSFIPQNTPLTNLPGWTIYGPDAQFAHKFSSIGHLGYDGNARFSAYIKISEINLVPHISLLTPGITSLPPIDNKGRLIINTPDVSSLIKISKSMKFLMTDGEKWAKKVIQKGDVVLLLSEMYTGKVNFFETPVGSLPSGYIVASAVNSAISGQWLNDRSNTLFIIAIFLCLGLSCGLAPNFISFTVSFLFGITVIPTIGILSFALNSVIFPWVASNLFFAGAGGFVFFRRAQERLSSEKVRSAKIEKERDKLNAIVRTAQMFAHDVRKPFSMLNMTAQSIQKLTDADKIKSFMTRVLPELDRAMSSVEGMIQDIMEIDSKGSGKREQASVEHLIAECLKDAFRMRSARNVDISYDLKHTMDVDIHRLRVKRVVLNILDNALQAMGDSGRIWIYSCDVSVTEETFVEVTIGNANTFIEQDQLDRVFEAFYTNGKKGGTGLGLAIAQKVIVEHGGKISAKSKNGHGTEFTFTLPISHSTPYSRGNCWFLHQHSSTFCNADQSLSSEAAHQANHLRTDLNEVKDFLRRKIKILIIDDERIYLDSIRTILTNGHFDNITNIEIADSPSSAIEAAKIFVPDVILCDIDLGVPSVSGFDLVATLRREYNKSLIIIHSNRVFQLDSNNALNAGADIFLPKPIDELKLIEVIYKKFTKTEDPDLKAEKQHRDVVVVVDDDVFTLEAWTTILDDAEIMTFESPTQFWQYLADNKSFINDIKLIVTDFYFDNESHETGESFATKIKEIGNIPILLSSNAIFSDLPAVFDGMIGKEPTQFHDMRQKIKKFAS